MRIIVNAISANTGGIVTYTSNLIAYIAELETDAIIYVPRAFETSAVTSPHVTIRRVPVKRFYGSLHRFLWEQIVWRKIVRESGADILFSSANYGVLFPPIPQVLLVQGEIYLNPVYREKVLPHLSLRERLSAYLRRNHMLWSARQSRTAIFPSDVALNAALDYGPDIKENSTVNYLGVSSTFTVPPESRRAWKRDGVLNLLYVSVYYPHKDPVTLAEAARHLNDGGTAAKARITMEVGDFDPWPTCHDELERLRSSRYADCLTLGRIEHHDLAGTLRDTDIFVFPSMAETFGFPMVEAMRAGIPLVVSDIPVHREICGDSALYFELGNADDLARCILELDENPALRGDLVASGRQRAEILFSWKNHVGGLAGTFRSIAGPRPVRLLINGLHARTGGGVTYLKNMLPLFADSPDVEVHLCAHEDQRDIFPGEISGITYHFMEFRRGFWNVLLREQVDLPILAHKIAADVTFSPANYGPLLAPNPVIMVRNAVSVGFVERRPLKLAYWALLYAATLLSLATCRRAIAVSEYARQVGTGVFWQRLRRRISVVPHGVNEAFRKAAERKREEDLILAVSDIYVQKNFINLIEAVAKLRETRPEIELRIAGRPVDSEYLSVLQDLVHTRGMDGCVKFLGAVDTGRLIQLYHECAVFVFPSTVETFGNPLVEAMACGAPIACSRSTAMPEVLGDAGLYFDPYDSGSMAKVISEILSEPALRQDLSAKAKRRSGQFSWNKTRDLTIDTIKAAGTRKPKPNFHPVETPEQPG